MRIATVRTIANRLAVGLGVLMTSGHAHAHVVHGDAWAVTLRNLTTLVPAADPNAWKVQRVTYSEDEAKALTKALGFELYPQDRSPEFFIAHDAQGTFLGVAMFIDARAQPKIVDGRTVPLRVGVGVDARGQINAVRVYDYDGPAALNEATFLGQLLGRNAQCSFAVGKRGLTPVPDAVEDSALVASAGREALVLMATALGSAVPQPACPLATPPAKRK